MCMGGEIKRGNFLIKMHEVKVSTAKNFKSHFLAKKVVNFKIKRSINVKRNLENCKKCVDQVHYC